jgi:hypothetical protein
MTAILISPSQNNKLSYALVNPWVFKAAFVHKEQGLDKIEICKY